MRRYQSSEKAITDLEIELAKSQKEIKSMNSQHSYLEKQHDSLKAASQPKEELKRLNELNKIISGEEKEIDKLIEGSKQALKLQNNIENAGGERLKAQKAKVNKIQSDIDKHSTDINRHKVQIETGQKIIKKLTKGIEESKLEKEILTEEREKLQDKFKEIEQKPFLQFKRTTRKHEMIDKYKDELEKAKADYNKMKKIVDELRATEVDADYKLQDLKKQSLSFLEDRI